MSLKYRDSQGNETPVAGLNGTSGELVPSVTYFQKGKIGVVASGSGFVSGSVTFTNPMPDTDYVVVMNTENSNTLYQNRILSKTVNGFEFRTETAESSEIGSQINFEWTAFKLMTDTVHEADSAHIAQNTANFAPAFSEVTSYAVGDYCTYNNVLYRCTTAHTAGTWVAGHFTQVTVGSDLSDIMPSAPSNGLITITAVSGANANATTTYTNVGVGDLVNVVIDSGVLFIPSWWGTVSGLSSLGITHIQNIQGISGECRILARVCKTDSSLYLDFLRDSGVVTKKDLGYAKFPTAVINSTQAIKITRNSVASGSGKYVDVFGNVFMIGIGDQLNRFYVTRVVDCGTADITTFARDMSAMYIYSNTYQLHFLELLGDLSYEVIAKSAIPAGAETVTIQ